MTEEQIRIADDLLKYLSTKGGEANLDQWPAHMKRLGHGRQAVIRVEQILMDLRLVRKSADNYRIYLIEPLGSRAVSIGLGALLDGEEAASRPRPSVTIGNQFNGPATHVTTGPVVQGSSLRDTSFGPNTATNTATATTYHHDPKKSKNDTAKQLAIGVALLIIGWIVKWWWTGEPF